MQVRSCQYGFTLIELSMVLVIIGLIAGAIFVGQDLIKASAVSATVSQYEEIESAVMQFKEKYNALPGDLTSAQALQYNLPPTTRYDSEPINGTYIVHGDGFYYDGWEGIYTPNMTTYGFLPKYGAAMITFEMLMFWQDLSSAKIWGGFTLVKEDVGISNITASGLAQVASYLPQAKIGTGNFWSVATAGNKNYLTINHINALLNTSQANYGFAMSATEAAAIDTKMDDGLPYSGKVMADTSTATGASYFFLLYVDPSGSYNSPANVANCAPYNNYNVSSVSNAPVCNLAIRTNF